VGAAVEEGREEGAGRWGGALGRWKEEGGGPLGRGEGRKVEGVLRDRWGSWPRGVTAEEPRLLHRRSGLGLGLSGRSWLGHILAAPTRCSSGGRWGEHGRSLKCHLLPASLPVDASILGTTLFPAVIFF
jgi:hypothetical protein